jgi:hypothetical protein
MVRPVGGNGWVRRIRSLAPATEEEVACTMLRDAKVTGMDQVSVRRKSGPSESIADRVEKAVPVDPSHAGDVLKADRLSV